MKQKINACSSTMNAAASTVTLAHHDILVNAVKLIGLILLNSKTCIVAAFNVITKPKIHIDRYLRHWPDNYGM